MSLYGHVYMKNWEEGVEPPSVHSSLGGWVAYSSQCMKMARLNKLAKSQKETTVGNSFTHVIAEIL